MKRQNVIIDTDPGVDDMVGIIPALYNKRLNILLFTTVSGNVSVEQCTNNLLHILDVYSKDYPVAKGASKPLKRAAKDAKFIHQEFGLGKYVPKTPIRQPITASATEAMYETILKNKHNITILALGPLTNIALLLKSHPDAEKYISRIVMMGTSRWGKKTVPTFLKDDHCSFNTSSDPEALKIVLNSSIKLEIIPSEIGRFSRLTPAQVDKIKEYKIGKVMHTMLDGYWEPGVPEKMVAMNDTCTVFYALYPRLFKMQQSDIKLTLGNKTPGKTEFTKNKHGRVKVAVNANRKKLHKIFFKNFEKIEKFGSC